MVKERGRKGESEKEIETGKERCRHIEKYKCFVHDKQVC